MIGARRFALLTSIAGIVGGAGLGPLYGSPPRPTKRIGPSREQTAEQRARHLEAAEAKRRRKALKASSASQGAASSDR